MSAIDLQKLFQEVVILGTGRGASSAEVAWLEGFYKDGDWAPLVHLVNSYMDTVSAQKGLVPTIKAVALQALGYQIDDAEAEAVGQLLTSGQKTWADLFAWCIERTDALGQTLSNRAEAAQAFVTDLASAGKSALFAGAAVENAVKTLLQGITASSTSLGNGKAGLGALVAALTEQGIKSTVVDGYIKGATVFVDANGNGELDAGELSTTTDASGNYVLPSDASGGKVIAFGGTDILTGKAFSGVLTAPAGSTVVNPITTLLEAMVSSGTPVAKAKAAVQTAFNLPSDINLLTYDPLSVLADTNASTEAKNAALEVQKAALQVSNVIAQAAAAIDAASTAATLQTAASSVINALAQTVVQAAGTGSAFIPHQVLLGTSGEDGFFSLPQQMAIYYPLGGSDTISFGDPGDDVYGVERIVGLEWGANGDRLDFTLYLGGVQLTDADTNTPGIQAFTAATSGVSSPADISGKVALVRGDIPDFFLDLFDSGATFSLQPGAKAVVIQEAPSTTPSEHRAIIQFVSRTANGTGMHATPVADILFASGSSIQSAVVDNLTPPFGVVGSDPTGHIFGYGLVTVTENGSNYVFTPENGSPVTVPKTQYTGYILHGVTLVGAMDVLNGMVVAGYGNVQATGNATGVANLAGIGTDITFASDTLNIAEAGSVIVQSGPVSGDTLQITGTSGGGTETLQVIGTPDGDSIDVSHFTTTDAWVIVSGDNGNDTITLSSTAEEAVGFSAASQGTDTVHGFNSANDRLSFVRPNFGGTGISLAGAGTQRVSVTGSSSSQAHLASLGDHFSGVIRVGNTAVSDFTDVAVVITGAITGNNPGINAIVLVGNGADTRVYFWNDADSGSQANSQVEAGELTWLATLVGVSDPTVVQAFSAG